MTEGGVTYYQTRAARETVRSPSNERTWLKTACHDEQYLDNAAGEAGEYLGGATGAAGGPRGLTLVQDGRLIDACATCAAVAADVLRELGTRRRSQPSPSP